MGGGGVVEDGEQEAEDGFLGVVLGEDFVEDFGVKAEDGDAGVVDWGGKWRADDLQLVEADEFLAGLFSEPGAGDGHGFERAAKALAALECGLGDAFDAAKITGEKADDEVGLMHRPGA